MSEFDLASRLLRVSELFVQGEIALQQEQWDEAASLLTEAVAIEKTLHYGEPPQYLQPVRHTLGAVYLKAGMAAEAEAVYRADLKRWPANGWSLLGLARALEMQGKTEDAEMARAEFDAVWADADREIERLVAFLGGSLDRHAMVEVVDPSLRHH